jgi:hypothetical protein
VVDVQPVVAETIERAELFPVGVRAFEVLGPVFRPGRELVVHRAECGLVVRGDRARVGMRKSQSLCGSASPSAKDPCK